MTRSDPDPNVPETTVPPNVSGHLVFDYGLPADDVLVRAYHRGFGGEDVLLAEAKADRDGSYALAYRAVGPTNLQLRTVEETTGEEIPLSHTRFGAGPAERIDLVVPGSVRPLAPEHDRLADDLEQAIGGATAIGRAREDADREDLGIARELSGWDARLLALAANAAQVGEATGLPADALYGLFRTGLPTDPARLARVDPRLIGAALKRAVDAGVIGRGNVKEARAAFAAFAPEELRRSKAPGAVSSLGELLDGAGLAAGQQQAWEEIYAATPPEKLWREAEKQLPANAVERLRTQGKLAALTLNNAPLMRVLQERVGETGLTGLVDAGYHDPAAWEQTLRETAAADALDAAIPSAYGAPTTDDRAAAYAADMARKVRLAFPTRVVGHLLETGALRLGETGADVGGFLKQASEEGFELGRMPVEQLFAEPVGGKRKSARRAAVQRPSDEIVAGVKTVQRVFQLTPTNEGMGVLLDAGLHAARDVVAIGRDRFLATYGDRFGTTGEGELVWRRAGQVHSVTYGLFTSARALDGATPVHAISGEPSVRAAAKASLVKQYPTLEQLFGSLDFCECDACRSVLGPAAYLVDLLQFLNPPQQVWDAFTADWNGTHGKQFAPGFAAECDKPFDQLDRRRPDLAQLPLTCENTNTALPYIDVVNEILEYDVAHGSLAGDAGHDTGTASSQELLAEPQHVLATAYDTLLAATYPLGLPFDPWIATVRALLAAFDVPLWQLLETFRATDELFDPQAGASAPCYRAQIFVESLGIAPAERALLTQADPAASWWTLYGFANDGAARTALASAKTLAERLGLTYAELVAAIETRFVNPQPATLVLASPDAGCDFEATTLQHADGSPASAVDFVRLNLFVRLRRTLGWTIEELDGTLTALLPPGAQPLTSATIGPALGSAILYLAHLETLRGRLGLGPAARQQLAALWSGGAVHGTDLLARALHLAPADLATLAQLSGLDPLTPLAPAPLNADPAQAGGVSPLADDHPFSQTLRFAEVAEQVAASPFSIAELRYLLVHDPDSVARVRPDVAPAHALVRGLRREIARIRSENRAPQDPATLDDDTLRQKLALVLPGPVVDAVMAMWSGTIEYTAIAGGVAPADALDPAPLAGFPLAVAYDAVTQELRLTCTGVLLDAARQQIEAADGSPLLAGLLDDVQEQAHGLFDRWLGTFLKEADLATLFAPLPSAPVAAQAALAARRTAMAAGLYPYLQARLIRQLVVTSLAAAHDADPALIESLATDASLLHDAGAGPATPLLDAFAAAGDTGLTVAWHASPDCSGSPLIDPPQVAATADTATKPSGTNSVRFSGCLEVTDGGPYRFFVQLDRQQAAATLAFAHLPDPPIAATAAADGSELSAEVDLKAGVLYPFTLELHQLGGGDARLLVLGETLPKDRLDRLALSPQAVVERVRRADVVLAKVLALAAGFTLSERELVHLLTHPADFAQLDLSALPADETTADVAGRFAQFERLAGYAALKQALALDGDELIDVFAHARRSFGAGADATQAQADVLADVCARVAALTRRDAQTVAQTARQLGTAATSVVAGDTLVVEVAELAQEQGLRRLWDALSLLQALGVPADAVGRWTAIVDAAAPQRQAIADDVKATIRARFDDDAWHALAQPVFDTLRKGRRDALVAYIVDKEGFDGPDRIYEHFLLDPEMEPVVQTSRIQLAIASVQLFVQRCLLNLEERVPPPAILDAPSWAWMKRYRLWEANRKIFLYPENWLEPEFRDDKTSQFKALEGSLLQGDVTSDAAEDAFLAYLQSLETIARLQIVSQYVEELDDATDVLHVVGRTYALPHAYWYRRFASGTWTPWEPVGADIEGDHVVAVKWRDRMHLFWVAFVEKVEHTNAGASPRTLADTPVAHAFQKQVQARLSWSAYVDGAWTPRASAPPFTAIEANVSAAFDRASVPISVTKETRADGTEGAVRVHLGGEIQQSFRLATKNAPLTIADPDPTQPPTSYYATTGWSATLRTSGAPLSIVYPERVKTDASGLLTETLDVTQQILGAVPEGPYGLLLPAGPLRQPRPDLAPLAAPFFLADEANTFFVAPEVREDTFDEWDHWVIDDLGDGAGHRSLDPGLVHLVPLAPQVPLVGPVVPDPGDPWPIHVLAPPGDWLTDPATVVQFGDALVAEHGHAASFPPGTALLVVGAAGLQAASVGPIASIAHLGGTLA